MVKVLKLVLMVAVFKHGMIGIPKAKDKHIELNEHRKRSRSFISLIVA